MKLALAAQDGERSSLRNICKRAWRQSGGEQNKRLRRLVPDGGITIHVPSEEVMKRLWLSVEDADEWFCCEVQPVVVADSLTSAHRAAHEPLIVVSDEPPEDHLDDDGDPVPPRHMSKREARWFLWFSVAFTASLSDEARYTAAIGSTRWPVFTQDRNAGIGCLHVIVANSSNDNVRERARIVLGKFDVEVSPPPEPPEPE